MNPLRQYWGLRKLFRCQSKLNEQGQQNNEKSKKTLIYFDRLLTVLKYTVNAANELSDGKQKQRQPQYKKIMILKSVTKTDKLTLFVHFFHSA